MPESPSQPPSAKPSLGHHSPAALAARRANLLKARSAPRERIYRPTEKRQAANRRNLAKAQAALRAPGGSERSRMNALKHGLFAREFSPATLRRLGEDPQEFREMHRLLRRVFVPRERPECELVARLAETCWRRLRLFRAQALREQQSLRRTLESVPVVRRALGHEETELRAQMLVMATFDFTNTVTEALKLQSQIECLLRALVRKRSAGTVEFGLASPRRDSRIAEVPSLALDGKPIAQMDEDELTERLRYFTFDRLFSTAKRQLDEEDEREIAALLAELS
ncbi:MAG: hypothetical protein P8Z30_20215 [Acidobacteriota bacterium]